jgi:hypothetical protein
MHWCRLSTTTGTTEMAINYASKPKPAQAGKSEYSKFLEEPKPKTQELVKGQQVVGTTQVGDAVTHEVVHPGVMGSMKVGCGGSRTINLGNYESIKLSCWIEVPCEKTSLAETWDFASDWVGNRLKEAEQAVKGK